VSRFLVHPVYTIDAGIASEDYEHVNSSKHGQPADRQTDRYIQIKTAQTYM